MQHYAKQGVLPNRAFLFLLITLLEAARHPATETPEPQLRYEGWMACAIWEVRIPQRGLPYLSQASFGPRYPCALPRGGSDTDPTTAQLFLPFVPVL